MITPRFSLSQTPGTLTITVRAPHVDLNDLETTVEDSLFIFTSPPYYLRLNLPGKIHENDSTSSSYNADTGECTFTFDKQTAGEHFDDLEMITKFLCRKVKVNEGDRKIEVLSSEGFVEAVKENADVAYGFAMRGGYEVGSVSEEFGFVFEVNPIEVRLVERRKLRLEDEDRKFSVDHYICDLIEDEEIQEIVKLKSPFGDGDIDFGKDELDFLKDLCNVEYNLSEEQICYCHNGLLELVFAYCYDRRTTYFEGTCESGWTILKLCANISWFDGFLTPKETLVCCFRRSLIYPLYRNFKLSSKIFEDVKSILNLGENFLIKCLIEIYNIFLSSDRYIINNIFIKDYIIYVQKWDKNLWHNFIIKVLDININISDLGLNLQQIETSLTEDGDLCHNLSNLDLNHTDSDDSDDSN